MKSSLIRQAYVKLVERLWYVETWGVWIERLAEETRKLLGEDVALHILGNPRDFKYGFKNIGILVVSKHSPSTSLEEARLRAKILENARILKTHPFTLFFFKSPIKCTHVSVSLHFSAQQS